MEPKFIVFRTFNDLALAENLVEQLEKHRVAYTIGEEPMLFNGSSIFNTDLAKRIDIKISPNDFSRVNDLLAADEIANVGEMEKDYYLFDFTNTELLDVITKADEWSSFDVVLAQKILTERGIVINDETLSALKNSRIDQLSEPEPPQTYWVIIGYLASLLGGVFGIFIGWHLAFHKKTLPNGNRVFEYNEKDRAHGKIIFYLSIAFFAAALIFRLLPMFFAD